MLWEKITLCSAPESSHWSKTLRVQCLWESFQLQRQTYSAPEFTVEKRFLCEAVVREHLSIKIHLLSARKCHTRESYECDECGKFFSQSSYIKTHKRIHSRTKPYVCSEYGKVCISSPHLSQHKEVHTTGKPMDKVQAGNSLITPASLTPETSHWNKVLCVQKTWESLQKTLPPSLAHETSHEERPYEGRSFGAPLPAFIKFI